MKGVVPDTVCKVDVDAVKNTMKLFLLAGMLTLTKVYLSCKCRRESLHVQIHQQTSCSLDLASVFLGSMYMVGFFGLY